MASDVPLYQIKKGDGIIPITLAPEHEGDTLTGTLLNSNKVRGLKYEEPEFPSLDKANLTQDMVSLLDKYMDKSNMTEEHKAAWAIQRYNVDTESDNEEDLESRSVVEIENMDDVQQMDTMSHCSSSGGTVTLGDIDSHSDSDLLEGQVEV